MTNSKIFKPLFFLVSFFLAVMTSYSQTKLELEKITHNLEEIYDSDQFVRKELNDSQNKYGYGSEEYKQKLNLMNHQDSINRNYVFLILERYGWISKSISSENAGKALFYVIQHSELEAQIKYKELIKQASQNLEISSIEYAMFDDRINVRLGKNQLYGTQSAIDNIGNSYLYPCDNIDSVNMRRSEIGLNQLASQLESNNIKYPFPTGKIKDYDINIIGHFWNKNNIGINNISLWHGNQVIGQSDSNGFLYVKYSFFNKNKIFLTIKNEEKIIGELPLISGKDFYDISINID